MDDALYEIESMRRFAGLRINGPIPDETTILKFRHLLEAHSLGRELFNTINKKTGSRGAFSQRIKPTPTATEKLYPSREIAVRVKRP